MDNAYLSQVRSYLLLSKSKQDEVLRELKDHIHASRTDALLEGRKASSYESQFGDPAELARQFNASHIPLYSFIFSDLRMSLAVIALCIFLRSLAITIGVTLKDVHGLIGVETASFAFHFFLLAYIYTKKPLVDSLFRGWRIVLLALSVQGISLFCFFMADVPITSALLQAEFAKLTVYILLVPVFLPLMRQVVRQVWLKKYA